MTDTLVIGLGGKLRSGKDTVADYLASNHDFVKIGMSDALRLALYTQNPWIHITEAEARHLFELTGSAAVAMGSTGVRTIISPFDQWIKYRVIEDAVGYTEAKDAAGEVREALQVLGTEVGRQIIGENVWVDIAERGIAEYRAQGRSVALTGVRFENEQSMIRRIGGTLAWIERPGLDTATAHAAHASEQATGEDFDLTISNAGTLHDLYANTETLVASLWAMVAAENIFEDAAALTIDEQRRAGLVHDIVSNNVFDHQVERPTAIEAFIARQAAGTDHLQWLTDHDR